MRKVCNVIIDETCKDNEIRKFAFSAVSRENLINAISVVDKLVRPPDEHYEQEVIELYGRVRRFLPTLLKTVEFHSSPSGQPVLRILQFLKGLEGKRKPDMSKAPLEGISKVWKRKIIDSDKKINRRPYTLYALGCLQDNLRRRDVFCIPSERWGDPRMKLLKGKNWESIRDQVCCTLGRKKDAKEELSELEKNLDKVYRQTVKSLPNNKAVRIEKRNGCDELILTGLDKLYDPPSLLKLRNNIAERLPHADLPEVLLEIHAKTGFVNEFTHISQSSANVSDFHISVCAVLLAEACNIGLEPLVRQNVPALTRGRLSWIQQNYIRADTLIKANARLVDAQTQIPLAQAWAMSPKITWYINSVISNSYT